MLLSSKFRFIAERTYTGADLMKEIKVLKAPQNILLLTTRFLEIVLNVFLTKVLIIAN